MRLTVDLNLEKLKDDMGAYLAASEFAVFYSDPGGLKGMPLVLWDVERYPDWRMFLDVARKAGVKIVMFAAAEFDDADLDEMEEQLEEGEFTREEQREYQARIRKLRERKGATCSLELAFDFHSRLYVYDVQPDWYDEFCDLDEEIVARTADSDTEDDDSLGGFYSKN
jgi:hypothetical protein